MDYWLFIKTIGLQAVLVFLIILCHELAHIGYLNSISVKCKIRTKKQKIIIIPLGRLSSVQWGRAALWGIAAGFLPILLFMSLSPYYAFWGLAYLLWCSKDLKTIWGVVYDQRRQNKRIN